MGARQRRHDRQVPGDRRGRAAARAGRDRRGLRRRVQDRRPALARGRASDRDRYAERGPLRPQRRIDGGDSMSQTFKYVPDFEPNKEEDDNECKLTASPFTWRDPVDIPPRAWLYGRHYIR